MLPERNAAARARPKHPKLPPLDLDPASLHAALIVARERYVACPCDAHRIELDRVATAWRTVAATYTAPTARQAPTSTAQPEEPNEVKGSFEGVRTSGDQNSRQLVATGNGKGDSCSPSPGSDSPMRACWELGAVVWVAPPRRRRR